MKAVWFSYIIWYARQYLRYWKGWVGLPKSSLLLRFFRRKGKWWGGEGALLRLCMVIIWCYSFSYMRTVVSYLNSFRLFNKINRYHFFLKMQHNMLIKTKKVSKDFPWSWLHVVQMFSLGSPETLSKRYPGITVL